MTVRELVTKVVKGLKAEFYSEQDKSRLVEYILDNSVLELSKEELSIKSHNLFGVGESNKDRALPFIPEFLIFFWGNHSEREGLNRHWYIKSLSNFEHLEYEISISIPDMGEYLAFVEMVEQPYKLSTYIPHFKETYVEWLNLQPYSLFYYTDDDSINQEEMLNSKKQVEDRIIELLKGSNINNFRVTNVVDDTDLGFKIYEELYSVDTKGNSAKSKAIFQWVDYSD